MKHLITAAAIAPLLLACASADARDSRRAETEARVLVVNGERIELGDGGDAAAAIEEVLERRSDDRRVRVHMELGQADIMGESEREAFAEAMAALASGFAHDAMIVAFGAEDFDVDFHFDADMDEAEIERRAARAERHVERHRDRMERHAERMARHAERLAERAARDGRRAEAFGRRMEVHGLAAGIEGLESGIEGLEEGLARGWVHDGGDRRELTEEDRAELEDARNELEQELERMRARLAEARERMGEDHRAVRIWRRDGQVRAWVDGEEVTGSELDALLEKEEGRLAGAPTPPQPPREPRE